MDREDIGTRGGLQRYIMAEIATTRAALVREMRARREDGEERERLLREGREADDEREEEKRVEKEWRKRKEERALRGR